jgi:hypothetical protein
MLHYLRSPFTLTHVGELLSLEGRCENTTRKIQKRADRVRDWEALTRDSQHINNYVL